MKRFVMCIGILLALFVLYAGVQAQAAGVPQLINYQGYLTDKDGNPLTTGEYTLSFSIYNVPTGGTPVWGPQTFEKVPVVKGYFNVILGPNDSYKPVVRPINIAFVSDQAYLSISVNDGAPITPRQQILSAPYAFEAVNAVNAIHGVPVGTVVAYYGNTAVPEGWLLCRGQPIPNEIKYQKLRELIGDNTPDLRGRTIIGAGLGTELQTDRGFGGKGGEENHTLTINEMPSHAHDFDDIFYSEIGGNTGVFNNTIGSNRTDYDNSAYLHRHVTYNNGINQPHNNMQPFYVLNFIIKY